MVDGLQSKSGQLSEEETLLLTATGTEQPPSRVFMKARSAIVANTVSLKIYVLCEINLVIMGDI